MPRSRTRRGKGPLGHRASRSAPWRSPERSCLDDCNVARRKTVPVPKCGVSVRVGEAPQFWLNASDERFATFPTMRVRPDADAVHRAADVLARVESASEAIERSGGKVVGTIRWAIAHRENTSMPNPNPPRVRSDRVNSSAQYRETLWSPRARAAPGLYPVGT